METTFAGVPLEMPVVNAAGTCKTLEEVREFAQLPIGAVTVGSITVEPREGNEGAVYWSDPGGGYSLNSLGLPNPGIPYYERALPQMKEAARDAGKPLIASIAGFSPDEYAALAVLAAPVADVVELNLGCPNVWGGGEQKPIASYNPDLVKEILERVLVETYNMRLQNSALAFAVKLSPLPPDILGQVADVIKGTVVRGVIASNTWPNGFAWDNGKPAVTPGGGLAGLAGPALKGVALGQVVQFRSALGPAIDVMGTGGVQTGTDVQDYLRAGAKAVGVNTAFANKGYGVFTDIALSYAGL